MRKPYVVATNADYTLVVMAHDEEDAVDVAYEYTLETYGEERDDFVAYDMINFLNDYNGIWEI